MLNLSRNKGKMQSESSKVPLNPCEGTWSRHWLPTSCASGPVPAASPELSHAIPNPRN